MVGMPDIITYANFGDDRLRGLEVAVGKVVFYAACAAQATPIGCNTFSLQSDMVY